MFKNLTMQISQPKTARKNFMIGVFILIISNMAFSTKAIIIKLMYQYHVDTMSVLALRMLFSAPFYVGILVWLSREKPCIPVKTNELWAVCGLGILSYYISSMLDFLGLQYISAGIERLILFTYPTIVVLLSFVLFKKKITPPQYFALILTYIGIAIAFIAEKGVGEQKNFIYGSVLIFCCAITFSFFVIGTGQLAQRVGTLKFTCYAVLAAAIPALIQSFVHNQLDIFHFPREVYVLSIWLAVVATVLPTFLIVKGISLVGASNSGIIGFVGPVWTIFLAHWLLNEPITPLQLLGTAIVLLGVLLISWKGK